MSASNEAIRIWVRGRVEEPRVAIEVPHAGPAAPRAPAIDIHEAPDALYLEADLPGASEHSVAIEIDRNVLSLAARTTANPPDMSGARLLHQEFPDGDFARSFILSDEIERERITAEIRNGVLELKLPKLARHTTRRIEVRGAGADPTARAID